MSTAGEPRPIAPGLFVIDPGGPRLIAGRCTACGQRHFPAAESCPYCGRDAEPERVGPRGTLRLFTVVHTAPPGYGGPLPYGMGVVELDGMGLEVVTRLDETDLARLRPGLTMELRVAPLFADAGGAPVLCWTFTAVGP